LNDDFIPKDDNGVTIEGDGSYIETWKAMEKLVHNGLTKSIGVSNFNRKQIEDILCVATVKPVNNQVGIFNVYLIGRLNSAYKHFVYRSNVIHI